MPLELPLADNLIGKGGKDRTHRLATSFMLVRILEVADRRLVSFLSFLLLLCLLLLTTATNKGTNAVVREDKEARDSRTCSTWEGMLQVLEQQPWNAFIHAQALIIKMKADPSTVVIFPFTLLFSGSGSLFF